MDELGFSPKAAGGPENEALREREKELDFVYEAAVLLSKARLRPEEACPGLARLLASAMGRPDLASVTVVVGEHSSEVSSAAPYRDGEVIAASYGEGGWVRLDVRYPGVNGTAVPAVFSERERALCASAVRLLGIAAERMEAENREEVYRAQLERKNAALSELISRIEIEKRTQKNELGERIGAEVYPILTRMASLDQNGEGATLAMLARNAIENAFSGGNPRGEDPRRLLSMRELEVCELASAGLSSKEIAERLSITRATVERHRHNARRKLGMPDRKGSLRAALMGTNV